MAAGGELGGGGVVGAHAGLHGSVAEGDCQHRLADPWWADQQHVALVGDKPQGGELGEELTVDRWLGVEVEVGDPPGRGQAGKPGQGCLAPGFGGGHLDREQPFQERGVAGAIGGGTLERLRQGLGRGGHAQRGQVAAEALVDRGLAHRMPPTRSARSPSKGRAARSVSPTTPPTSSA